MASSTVDIARFRCHPVKHDTFHSNESAETPARGLYIVAANPAPAQESAPAAPAIPPGVYDFAAARERHSARVKACYDPSPFSRRRSNLVRFNEPRVAVLRVAARAHEAAYSAGDDRDLPPAA